MLLIKLHAIWLGLFFPQHADIDGEKWHIWFMSLIKHLQQHSLEQLKSSCSLFACIFGGLLYLYNETSKCLFFGTGWGILVYFSLSLNLHHLVNSVISLLLGDRYMVPSSKNRLTISVEIIYWHNFLHFNIFHDTKYAFLNEHFKWALTVTFRFILW